MPNTPNPTPARRFALLLLPLLGAPACDSDYVGVHEFLTRTTADGDALEPMASCVLLEEEGSGSGVGGGGGGPGFATEMIAGNGKISLRYYIAPEEDPDADISGGDGELAAEIEADMEFFDSGETKHVTFESYDGIVYEAYLWGEADCEGDLPTAPPPGA